jgi:AcrR family transcriptional regulator
MRSNAMSLLNDERASELVGEVRAARSAAHELVGKQISRSRERIRSSSKTRKSVRTKERIMHAASELMAERGNTNFQMSEVAKRCQLSKGSLYYYFADKDELIGALFDESVDELVEDIETFAAQAPSAREALLDLHAEFARRLRSGSPLAMAMTYELAGRGDTALPEVSSHFSRAAKVIAAQLERAKSEGVVRGDIDADVVAIFATGGLVATSLAVASGRAEDSADAVSAGILDLMLHGVGTSGAAPA